MPKLILSRRIKHWFAKPNADATADAEQSPRQRSHYPTVRGLIWFWIGYAYVAWPLPPRMPTDAELHYLTGMPVLKNPRGGGRGAGGIPYLTVGGIKMNSIYGMWGGTGGNHFFKQAIDLKSPVLATYFWMPSRIGIKSRMLHELEQNGRQIVSPERFYVERLRRHRLNWQLYYQLHGLMFFIICIVWFFERAKLKIEMQSKQG